MDPQDQDDGGFASRKFIFCVGSALLITLVGILAGTVMVGVAPLITQIYGGVLGAAALYCTGNIASQFVIAKSNSNTSFKDDVTPPPSQPVQPASKIPPVPGKAK